MDSSIRLFFAFVSLIAVGIIVIALVNQSKGTTAISNSVFSGFTGLLGQLNRVQNATPGSV